MNKSLFYGIVSFLMAVSNSGIAQIQTAPLQYKTITFVYETKSNFQFDDKGVYADTSAIKIALPGQLFQKIKSPIDASKYIGFISKNQLISKLKDELISLVFHSNKRTTYIFNVKNNTATVVSEMAKDPESKRIFKLLGSTSDGTTSFPYKIKYKDNYTIEYLSNGAGNTFNYQANLVDWKIADKLATITLTENGYTTTNAIDNDIKLSKYITPIALFANCEYGIKAHYSVTATTQLTSVIYK